MALIVWIFSVLCLLFSFQTRQRLVTTALSLVLAILGLYLWGPSDYVFIGGLALGLALVIFEACLPSFGILGLLGFLLIAVEVWLHHLVLGPLLFEILVAVYLGLLLALCLIRLVLDNPQAQSLVLKDRPGQHRQSRLEEEVLGQEAEVVAPLRPVGKICLKDGRILQAISEQDFIDRGQAVEVIAVQTNEVKVRKIDYD